MSLIRNILMAGFLVISSVLMAETPPKEAVDAAKIGLDRYMGALPKNSLEELEVFSKGKPLNIRIGDAYRVYSIDPTKLLGYKAGDSIDSMLMDSSLWMFMLSSGNDVKCVIEVVYRDNLWRAISIGKSGLAKNISDTKKKIGATEIRYARVLQSNSDFIITPTNELVPLDSARMILKPKQGTRGFDIDRYTLREVSKGLSPTVRENMGVEK